MKIKYLDILILIFILVVLTTEIITGNTYEVKGNIQEYNYFYVDAYIGSKDQIQSLILDTGSPLTTFPCKSICEMCGNHLYSNYDNKESESFNFKQCHNYNITLENYDGKPTQDNENECELIEINDNNEYSTQNINIFSISYAEGSSYKGYHAYEDIKFYSNFDLNKPGNIISNYPIGCVKFENFKLYDQKSNGILGLNMYEDYMSNGILKIPYFQITLYKEGGGLFSFDYLKLEYELGQLHRSFEHHKHLISIDLKNDSSYKFDIYGIVVDNLFVSLVKNIKDNKSKENVKIIDNIENYDKKDLRSKSYILINSEDKKSAKLKIQEDSSNPIYDDLINFETGESLKIYNTKLDYENGENKDEFTIKGEEVLIDSGSTLTLIPHKILNSIYNIFSFYCQDMNKCLGIMEKTQTTICWKSIFSEKDFYNSFPNIYISVNKENSEFIEWKPREYLIKMYFFNLNYHFKPLSDDIGYCLAAKESNSFVMGTSLMLDKTLFFDLKNKKLHLKHASINDANNKGKNNFNEKIRTKQEKNQNIFGLTEELYHFIENQFKLDILIFLGVITMLLMIFTVIKK